MSELLNRVREAVRTRHSSIRTEESYTRWIREFILFCDKPHPSDTRGRRGLRLRLTLGS